MGKVRLQVVIFPKKVAVLNPSVSPILTTSPQARLTRTALSFISGLLRTLAPVGFKVSSSSSIISSSLKSVGASCAYTEKGQEVSPGEEGEEDGSSIVPELIRFLSFWIRADSSGRITWAVVFW